METIIILISFIVICLILILFFLRRLKTDVVVSESTSELSTPSDNTLSVGDGFRFGIGFFFAGILVSTILSLLFWSFVSSLLIQSMY